MSAPAPRPKHKLRVPRPRRGPLRVLVGTRKGAFAIEGDAARARWEVRAPWHLGSTCFHLVADPRRSGTLLAAVQDPDGAATVQVSENAGEAWRAARVPPAFGETGDGHSADRNLRQVFWLTPGHAFQPGTWYCGTSPQGLFRTDDGGRKWRAVDGLHRHPEFDTWTSPATDETPDGPKLHSIIVDPRDPERLLVGLSTGGVLVSEDGGASWSRLDGGLEGADAADPHCVVAAATNPDRLRMPGSRAPTPGGPSSASASRPMATIPWAFTLGPPRGRFGLLSTRARAGSASRAAFRTSTASRSVD